MGRCAALSVTLSPLLESGGVEGQDGCEWALNHERRHLTSERITRLGIRHPITRLTTSSIPTKSSLRLLFFQAFESGDMRASPPSAIVTSAQCSSATINNYRCSLLRNESKRNDENSCFCEQDRT
ncbi:hypothetical protein B0J13DRAFT_234831 [Dactylonectria estremocensis]|uniref:Secreted protein n=1 Tax=Dactylonectria estremocensis TaxID=1079267 RepID=A0A9P9F6W2_9HYPO|nr:hypothetical protein B0J13DRAFT_234831 [Dactylonectria estremocensis]